MAHYIVTAGCGHTTMVQPYGSLQERDRRLTWMRSPSGMCSACYAAHKRAEEEEHRAKEIGAPNPGSQGV